MSPYFSEKGKFCIMKVKCAKVCKSEICKPFFQEHQFKKTSAPFLPYLYMHTEHNYFNRYKIYPQIIRNVDDSL